MDEGAPVAYLLVERGVVVVAADGTLVGVVDHVVAAPDQDIFHGLVIRTNEHGVRFVEAEAVAELHERGVDLRIDVTEVAELPPPGGAALMSTSLVSRMVRDPT